MMMSIIALCMVLIAIALPVLHQIRTQQFFAFDPLCFFLLGCLQIYFIDTATHLDDYVKLFGDSAINEALFTTAAAIFLVYVGYQYDLLRTTFNAIRVRRSTLSAERLQICLGLMIALGLFGWWGLAMSAGSIEAWLSVPRGGTDYERVSGFTDAFAALLLGGVSFFVLFVESRKRPIPLRILAWALMFALTLFFFYLGSRSRLIACVVAGLMAWYLPRHKNPNFLAALALFALVSVLTSIQASYRDQFYNLSFNLNNVEMGEIYERAAPMVFRSSSPSLVSAVSPGSELGMTVATLALVPDVLGYNYGKEFLQIATQPIPRSLWPEKRYPRGEAWSEIHVRAGTSSWWVDHISVPYIAGPSPGYVASWYYIGGFFGLVVGGIITGSTFRYIRSLYTESAACEKSRYYFFIFAPIGFLEATTHPLNWMYSLPSVVALLFLLFKICETRDSERHAYGTS